MDMYVPVLVEELVKLCGCVLIQRMRELGDRRRNFEALVKDNLLALKANIGGPFHKPSKITFRLNIAAYKRGTNPISGSPIQAHGEKELTDPKVLWGSFKERIFGLLSLLLRKRRWRRGFRRLGLGGLYSGSLRRVSFKIT